MGLFGKKKKKEKLPEFPKASDLPDIQEYGMDEDYSDIPELPELPKLPEFPKLPKDSSKPFPSKLLMYPPTKTGDKFSQDTIKEAVTGGKEGEEMADDFDDEQMMPKLPKLNLKKTSLEFPTPSETSKLKKLKGPVFIRIDKFEESLKTFEEMKEKVAEMEKLIGEVKHIKEKEERELSEWEHQMQAMKNQVEKVEKDLFSKIE